MNWRTISPHVSQNSEPHLEQGLKKGAKVAEIQAEVEMGFTSSRCFQGLETSIKQDQLKLMSPQLL